MRKDSINNFRQKLHDTTGKISGKVKNLSPKDKKKEAKETVKNTVKVYKDGKEKMSTDTSTGKKRLKINSIKTKLIGSFLVPVVLIIILGVLSYTTASKAIISNYEEANMSTIAKTADYYGLIFNTVESTSTEIINNTTLKNYYSRMYKTDLYQEGEAYQEIQKYFNSIIIGSDTFSDIYVACSYGNDIRTSNNTSIIGSMYPDLSQSADGAMVDAQKKGFFSTHPYIDEKIGSTDYAFTFGRQIYSNSTKPCGYLFMDIKKDKIYESIKELNMGEDSIVSIILPDGGEISYLTGSTGDDPVLSDVREPDKYVSNQDFYTELVNNTEAEEGYKYIDYNGSRHLFIYSKVGNTGFVISALVPESVITAQAASIRNVTVIMVIIAMIAALVIGSMMAAGMSLAMSKITTKLEAVSDGDLTVHVALKRKDEFRNLATSINLMIAKTKGMIEDTLGISDEVSKSAEVVSGNSKVLLEATKNITDAITEIQNGVIQQSQDSENCMREVEALADKMNKVGDSSNNIAKAANGALETVNSGRVTISELGEKAQDTVAITADIITEMESLENSSKQIESIVGAINEIADQTSLLSLNASIEAARAGEAGRGFAVVADEIRKLADQSAASANQIKKIIDDIKNKTSATVVTAKKASDIVASQGESLDKTVNMFNDIESQVGKLVEELEQIKDNVADMQSGKEQTVSVIESISAVSEETTAMVEEVTATAERQLQAVEKLNNQAQDLFKNSEELIGTVKTFKVE